VTKKHRQGSGREVEVTYLGRRVRVYIARALDEEIDRESVEYQFELLAAEKASPEIDLLNRRYEQRRRRTLEEAEAENRRVGGRRIWRQIEQSYRVQLEAEGLEASPRYRTAARDAAEIAARPGSENAGRPLGDNTDIRAALGDEPGEEEYGVGAIVEQGPSGRDPGRPKLSYQRTIDEHLAERGERPTAAWRRAFGSGRLSTERRAERDALRPELAPLVRELIGPPGVLRRGGPVCIPKTAIASRLGVDRKALDRLLKEHAPK
jgi:hypothetical protein